MHHLWKQQIQLTITIMLLDVFRFLIFGLSHEWALWYQENNNSTAEQQDNNKYLWEGGASMQRHTKHTLTIHWRSAAETLAMLFSHFIAMTQIAWDYREIYIIKLNTMKIQINTPNHSLLDRIIHIKKKRICILILLRNDLIRKYLYRFNFVLK